MPQNNNIAFKTLLDFVNLTQIDQSSFDYTISVIFYNLSEANVLAFFKLPHFDGPLPLYSQFNSFLEGSTRFFSYLLQSKYSKAAYKCLLNFILDIKNTHITDEHLITIVILLASQIDPTVPPYQHRILLPICHKLAQANSTTLYKLYTLFAKFISIHERRCILQGCQHYISMIIYTAEANSPHGKIYIERTEYAAIMSISDSVMSALYRTISPFDVSSELKLSDFYNDAICKHINGADQLVKFMNGEDSIVWNTPFLINVAGKARAINLQTTAIRELESLRNFDGSPYIVIQVRREYAYQDLVNAISHYMQMIKYENRIFLKELKVKFEGESGVDEGGLRQELFTVAFNKLFDPSSLMFIKNETDRYYWFSNGAVDSAYLYQLIGLLLGLAIFNNILTDIPLPYVIFKKLMGETPDLDDIKDIFPSNHKGLSEILKMNEEEVESLCLDFSVIKDVNGKKEIIELIHNGSNVELTIKNRDRYVNLMLDYLVGSGIDDKFKPLREGFKIATHPITLISKFHPRELQQLCSSTQELDFNQLKAVTYYENCNYNSHPVISWFWKIITEIDEMQQRQFLMFVTGSDRAPVGGLSEMSFVIQLLNVGDEYLPTSHACFNILDLPKYSSFEITRTRFLKAIQYCEGFGIM